MYKKIFLLISIFTFAKSSDQDSERGRTLHIPGHQRTRPHSPLSWAPEGREPAKPVDVHRCAGGFELPPREIPTKAQDLPETVQEIDRRLKKVQAMIVDPAAAIHPTVVHEVDRSQEDPKSDIEMPTDPEDRKIVEFKIDVSSEKEIIVKEGYFLKNRDLEYFIIGGVVVAVVVGAGYWIYNKYKKPKEEPKKISKVKVPVNKVENVKEQRRSHCLWCL